MRGLFFLAILPECIGILAAIMLLGVSEEIHVCVDLCFIVSQTAARYDRIGLDFAQVASMIFMQIASGTCLIIKNIRNF